MPLSRVRSTSPSQRNREASSRKEKKAFSFADNPFFAGGPSILLIAVVAVLTVLGIVMVYSASSAMFAEAGSNPASEAIQQLVFVLIGIACCFGLARLPYQELGKGKVPYVIAGVVFALLLATMAIGTTVLGAQRWIRIGPISVQPSEFAKIGFMIIAAKLMVDYEQHVFTFKEVMKRAAVFVFFPLVFLYSSQSDLGTTAICFVGILAIMWLCEVSLKMFIGVLIVGVVFAVGTSIGGYRSDRFIFLDPESDPYGTGFQIIHSSYAFSQGGLFGVGIGNSSEKYGYLPEASSDFIFSIIGEELGLIGAGAVVILFVLFAIAGIRIANDCPDIFGRLLAGSLTTMLVFQAFLNMMMALGIAPITGKPLPFISQGGSSCIASFMMVGIILSVARHGADDPQARERRQNLRVIRNDGTGGAVSAPVSPRTRTTHRRQESMHNSRGMSYESEHRSSRSNNAVRSLARQQSRGDARSRQTSHSHRASRPSRVHDVRGSGERTPCDRRERPRNVRRER